MEKLSSCLEMVDTYMVVGNKGSLMVQYVLRVKKLTFMQITIKEKPSKQWYLSMNQQIMYFASMPKRWRKNMVFRF